MIPITDEIIERTRQHEGAIPWMYLDTKGYVTVGIGHLLLTPHSAAVLEWAIVGQPALEWATVQRSTRGKLPGFYKRLTTSRMSGEGMSQLCRLDLQIKAASLVELFPLADTLPASAQAALLDIHYNVAGGIMTFPRLRAAITRGDWVTAARESRRPELSADRNNSTAALFIAAMENREDRNA